MKRHFNYRQQVEVQFEEALHILRDEPGVLLGMVREAAIDLATHGGPSPHVMTPAPTPIAEHDIEVVLGPMRQVDKRAAMVPVSWSAVDGVAWFPAVDGEIEVIDLDERRPWTDVCFFGSYTPKLGILGAAIDAAATHGAVERTLQQFLSMCCDHIEETAALEREIATS